MQTRNQKLQKWNIDAFLCNATYICMLTLKHEFQIWTCNKCSLFNHNLLSELKLQCHQNNVKNYVNRLFHDFVTFELYPLPYGLTTILFNVYIYQLFDSIVPSCLLIKRSMLNGLIVFSSRLISRKIISFVLFFSSFIKLLESFGYFE